MVFFHLNIVIFLKDIHNTGANKTMTQKIVPFCTLLVSNKAIQCVGLGYWLPW